MYAFRIISRMPIRAGRLREGDKIPTEKELLEQFDVSRITVANALGELAREGVDSPHPGPGHLRARHSRRAWRGLPGQSRRPRDRRGRPDRPGRRGGAGAGSGERGRWRAAENRPRHPVHRRLFRDTAAHGHEGSAAEGRLYAARDVYLQRQGAGEGTDPRIAGHGGGADAFSRWTRTSTTRRSSRSR